MAVIKMNFLSQCLGMQTNVTICLPSFSFADIMAGRKDVYVPGMKYQVLWLLHGGTGDDSDYLHFSNITRYADNNKIAVVMPADYNAMYNDDPDGGAKYRTFIAEELPKMCRAIFPFSDKREDNFIAGLSMGGFGTGKISINYPENYAAALIMSSTGSLEDKDMPMNPELHIRAFTSDAKELQAKAKENLASGKKVPKYFITCGENDFLLEGSKFAANFLRETGYDVYEENVPGYAHEWDFWDLTLRKALNEWLPIRHSIIYPDAE